MIEFAAEVCGNLEDASSREWLETNGLGGFAIEGHFPDGAIHPQHLKDAFTPLVTCVMAMVASPSSGKIRLLGLARSQPRGLDFGGGGGVLFLAFGANNPEQTLGQNGNHAGSNEKGLNADILQTCNSTGRIVRM